LVSSIAEEQKKKINSKAIKRDYAGHQNLVGLYYAQVIRIIPENYLPVLLVNAIYADITLGVADISHEFR